MWMGSVDEFIYVGGRGAAEQSDGAYKGWGYERDEECDCEE